MALKLSKILKNYWTTVFIPSYIRYKYYKLVDKSTTFKFQGNDFKYFNHWYNTTWDNERTVEIPIICRMIYENNNEDFLEIGNVISHYFNIDHDIIDKYEKAKDVINDDVVDFQKSKNYKLIISISTLEHVGWDEKPRDPEKIFKALANLKKHLVPGGKLVVTIPLGYNYILDNYLRSGEIKFTENYYLTRISRSNKWKEVKSGNNVKHNLSYPGADVLFIGVYKN